MGVQKFKAKLVKDGEVGGWTKFDIPFDVEKVFKEKGYVKVKGFIDKHAFSGIKLMPLPGGQYCMAVKEDIRKAIAKGNGDTVDVIMEPDKSSLELPKPLLKALAAHPKAKTFFDSLTESNKNYFVQWISSAKQESTLNGRLEKTIEKLLAGKKFHEK